MRARTPKVLSGGLSGLLAPRHRYKVKLVCSDGSRPTSTTYAESPEHAVRKIWTRTEKLLAKGVTIVNGVAELDAPE